MAIMPWIRKAAIRFNVIDQPNARKVHSTPIPLMGGLAIVIGTGLATIVFHGGVVPTTTLGALAAGAVVAIIGLMDDKRALSARVRLLVQAAAVGILIYAGIKVQFSSTPAWVDMGLTFLWVIGVTNAINLMDNMDGLAAGVAAVAAAYIAVIAVSTGQFLISGLASVLFGACLGFLYFNFPPATIFMGDSGAYFLGFWLSVLALRLRFTHEVGHATWLVPILVLAVPLFDTTFVVFSRLARGIHPFTPGKDHLSHRLVNLGFDKRSAVLVLYLFQCGLGSLAFVVQSLTREETWCLVGILVGLALIIGLRLQKMGLPETPPKPHKETVESSQVDEMQEQKAPEQELEGDLSSRV